jgi:peroxiredoxin Q/BCP
MRDDIAAFSELGTEILAISGDYVYSHHAWAKHHKLPFRLLSDHTHEVARLYDTFNETSGYTRRSVFVIDKTGRIRYADKEYSLRDDSDYTALKKALKSLQD